MEGEEPNEETEGAEERAVAEEQQAAGDATEARRAWHAQRAHAGAVNCIAAHEEGLATASRRVDYRSRLLEYFRS